jgi:DNA-binding response OmpR family regulator
MPFVRARVLVVEDDADARRALAAYLKTTFDVVEATDGADAIRKLEADSFAAVLTDLAMPIIDGVGLIAWIQMHRPALVPCTFLVTGGARDARQKEWLATFDAHRVFVKPVEASEIIARIYAAIRAAV